MSRWAFGERDGTVYKGKSAYRYYEGGRPVHRKSTNRAVVDHNRSSCVILPGPGWVLGRASLPARIVISVPVTREPVVLDVEFGHL